MYNDLTSFFTQVFSCSQETAQIIIMIMVILLVVKLLD